MSDNTQRLQFASARMFVDNLQRYSARIRVVEPVDKYGLVAGGAKSDLGQNDVCMAALAVASRVAALLLKATQGQREREVSDVLWEACSLRPALWLWQLSFEMGVAARDVAGVRELARSVDRGEVPMAEVENLAVGVVRRIALLDGFVDEVRATNASLLCEAWTQEYTRTGNLSMAIRVELGKQLHDPGKGSRATSAICSDLLRQPRRKIIRSGIAADVVCRSAEGQTILTVEPGTYLDITHLESDVVLEMFARERKRYRTVRTVERPTQSRENITYLSHIWHNRVYDNRNDPQMADVLLDLEDEAGEKRRRYVTLPKADVRVDKKNPNVRYALVRTQEVMLHWYDKDEKKTCFERIGTARLVEQMNRSYETYLKSR